MRKWQAIRAARGIARAMRVRCVVFPEVYVSATGERKRIVERGVGKAWGWQFNVNPENYFSDGIDRPIGVRA